MFVLRTIFEERPAVNQIIGNHYTYFDRNTDYERFKALFGHEFGKDHVADLDEKADYETKNCYGIIQSQHGIHPLFKGMKAYIMTEGGKTFENLSFYSS